MLDGLRCQSNNHLYPVCWAFPKAGANSCGLYPFDLWMDILELLACPIARVASIEGANFHPKDYLAQLIGQNAFVGTKTGLRGKVYWHLDIRPPAIERIPAVLLVAQYLLI